MKRFNFLSKNISITAFVVACSISIGYFSKIQTAFAEDTFISSSTEILIRQMVDEIIRQNTQTSATSTLPQFKVDPITGLTEFKTIETSTTTLTIQAPMIKLWQASGGFTSSVSRGAKNTQVVMLQGLLAGYIPWYKKEFISGYFGEKTSKALKEFQKMYKLPQTGTVGPATKEVLNTKYVADLCPRRESETKLLENLDRKTAIAPDYVPPELTVLKKPIRTAGIVCLSEEPATKLGEMFADAKKAGHELIVLSGYRRFEIQELLQSWNKKNNIVTDNSEAVGLAEAGHSEHQLGTTVDISGKSIKYQGPSTAFGKTPEGIWLQKNSYKYGFVMSYPKDKEKITGYIYEPWHFRYIGVDRATAVYNSNTTIQEYLNTIQSTNTISRN